MVTIFLFAACTPEAKSTTAAQTPPSSVRTEPVATPSPTEVVKAGQPGVIWSAQSGDFEVVWTKDDIVAKRVSDGKQIYSAKGLAAERARTAYPEQFKSGKPQFEQMTLGYQVVSLAGKFLFLKETSVVSPQTSTGERFVAVDLSQPEAVVELTKFFPKDQIASAMKANTDIAADLTAKKIAATNYDEILGSFNSNAGESDGSGTGPFASCWVPKDVLRSFVIKAGDGEQVRVMLGIPCSDGMRDSVIKSVELNFKEKPLESIDVGAIRQLTANIPADGSEVYVTFK